MKKIQLEKSDCYFLVLVDGDYFGHIASTKDGWKCTPKVSIKNIDPKLFIEISAI